MMSTKMIKVTLIRSLSKRTPVQKQCASGLGLRRIGHTRELVDNAIVRGLINKIDFMLRVED